MNVRVKFFGGAQSVTGSKYLLTLDHLTVLVDCGLFQGLKELRLRNWSSLPVDPATIDAVILTHAHIDHSGYLPRLVRDGFIGPVYCTAATASLLSIMLPDAARLQEEEAGYAAKKGYSKHDKPLPLFDQHDAQQALSLVNPLPYHTIFSLTDTIRLEFLPAGHILGSSIVRLRLKGNRQEKVIIFSGDLGRYDQPLLDDPYSVTDADILFIESTYGNRLTATSDVEGQLAKLVNHTFNQGGCVLIPSFAVGRTQLLLYYFYQLLKAGTIPSCPVYIDSPMAISATHLHRQHREDHKLRTSGLDESIFDDPHFHYYREQQLSISLNFKERGAIIISASGMCTGGRILHHLHQRLLRKNDTLLFVGYQAEGTRGRRILDGEKEIKLFGRYIPVNCHVEQLSGLSAHADQADLLKWASHFNAAPKRTFVVHGEVESASYLKGLLTQQLNWPNVIVPEYLESHQLFSHF